MDDERIPESERLLMQHIRELDMEELQVEEIDDDYHPSDDEDAALTSGRGDGGAGEYGGFTFDPCLASLHTYLGEVDDIRGRLAFFDGGAILTLPMFYLEGVVLFPEATLPLRVIQPRFIAAAEKAMNTVNTANAPCTIGVIRIYRLPNGRPRFATTGTTAEIRQYRRLNDGTLNVVARGHQRFCVRRYWLDDEGTPCAEVQIVQEDTPLRTPKAAFGQLASVSNTRKYNFPRWEPSCFSKRHGYKDAENDSECMSGASITSDSSEIETDYPAEYGMTNESSSSREELVHGRGQRFSCKKTSENDVVCSDPAEELSPGRTSSQDKRDECDGVIDDSKSFPKAAMSFWPHWVYQMYDAYSLAQRAAELWKQVIVGNPSLDDYSRKPDLLSFHIASKIPMSETTRQELLDIDGVSYRLRREIQLLKCFDRVRCKNCKTLIAKRSDMVVMSSDGPVNAYVNPHGFVHEVITVHNAHGLALVGSPEKEYSWFPGYAWTITKCASCNMNMGWLFTATRKNLLPRSFWGIRSSQVVDGA